MSRPLARSPIVRVLGITSLLAGVSCGGEEAPETKPGLFRIARAIVTSLLSSSIEVSEIESSEGEPVEPTASPDADRSSQLLAAVEPDAPESCIVPYAGPVTIIAVRTPTALARSVVDRKQVRLVYETEDTAIWEDGRVLTLNVEELGTHLNAVGWAPNPVRILGARNRPSGSAARGGWSSGASSSGRSAKSDTRRRRTRRRG